MDPRETLRQAIAMIGGDHHAIRAEPEDVVAGLRAMLEADRVESAVEPPSEARKILERLAAAGAKSEAEEAERPWEPMGREFVQALFQEEDEDGNRRVRVAYDGLPETPCPWDVIFHDDGSVTLDWSADWSVSVEGDADGEVFIVDSRGGKSSVRRVFRMADGPDHEDEMVVKAARERAAARAAARRAREDCQGCGGRGWLCAECGNVDPERRETCGHCGRPAVVDCERCRA